LEELELLLPSEKADGHDMSGVSGDVFCPAELGKVNKSEFIWRGSLEKK